MYSNSCNQQRPVDSIKYLGKNPYLGWDKVPLSLHFTPDRPMLAGEPIEVQFRFYWVGIHRLTAWLPIYRANFIQIGLNVLNCL